MAADADTTRDTILKNGLITDAKTGRFLPGSGGRKKGAISKLSVIMRRDLLRAYRKKGGFKELCKLDFKYIVELMIKVMPKELVAIDNTSITAVEVAQQVEAMQATMGSSVAISNRGSA